MIIFCNPEFLAQIVKGNTAQNPSSFSNAKYCDEDKMFPFLGNIGWRIRGINRNPVHVSFSVLFRNEIWDGSRLIFKLLSPFWTGEWNKNCVVYVLKTMSVLERGFEHTYRFYAFPWDNLFHEFPWILIRFI